MRYLFYVWVALFLLLIAMWASGCTPVNTKAETHYYETKNSQYTLDVMMQCAGAIQKIPIELTDEDRDLLYTDCLITNNATI